MTKRFFKYVPFIKMYQLLSVNQIDKVFTAANHKKVWDHFTKAQRKNIDLWKKSLVRITKKEPTLVLFFFIIKIS